MEGSQIMSLFLMFLISLFLISLVLIWKVFFFDINKNDSKLKEEAKRILFGYAEVNSDYTSEGKIYTRGLSLVKKNKDDKYTLIAQAKVCDIGLS